MPLLRNVLFEQANGRLRLHVTDVDNHVEIESWQCGPDSIAPVLLDARELRECVKTGAEPKVDALNGVVFGHARLASQGSVADWPVAHVVDTGIEPITYDAIELRAKLKYVVQAASTDPTHEHVRSVYFETDGITATDGHRLHHCALSTGPKAAILVLRSTIDRLLVLLRTCKAKCVDLRTNGRYVRFTLVDGLFEATITARLSDTTFPDYRRVYPDANQACLTASTNSTALYNTAREAKPFVKSSKYTPTPIALEFGADSIRVSDTDGSKYTATVQATVRDERKVEEGEELTNRAGYNARYIEESMSLEDSSVTLRFYGGSEPLYVVARDGYEALVMPTRL